MLENIGLIFALLVLISCALRGFSIILASLLATVVVIVTNHLPLADSLLVDYSTGPLGGFRFAGNFFLLFVTGAVFGRVMAETKAAQALARLLADAIGKDRALWIITGAFAILTYGGVVVFIVIFALYPLGVELVRDANIPKRLFCGAATLGAGTFTMTALPGTPSIHNAIAAKKLGTDLFAAPGLGLLAAAIMFGLGMWYLERERKRAAASGENFVPAPHDAEPDSRQEKKPSSPAKAIIPLFTVIGLILLPKLLSRIIASSTESWLSQCVAFANSNPILWPSIALVVGMGAAIAIHRNVWPSASSIVSRGAQDAIMPLINTAVVVGFGGVVARTQGFSSFSEFVLDAPLPPLLSLFFSVNVMAGIVGSSLGGLRIFMETLAPNYLEMGVQPDVLHRIATVASGGLDSLPHCGAVIASFTIMGLTHRQAYRDVFIVSVLIPLIAALVLVFVASFF